MSKNGRQPVLKVRYRKPGKQFGAKLTLSRGGRRNVKGRILSVKKVSREQLMRVHEYLPFDTDALLREFRESEKGGRRNARYDNTRDTGLQHVA